MRISDWSSDVCSSDLKGRPGPALLARGDHQPTVLDRGVAAPVGIALPLPIAAAPAIDVEIPFAEVVRRPLELGGPEEPPAHRFRRAGRAAGLRRPSGDRTNVVEGKSVVVRIDIVRGRILKKNLPPLLT